MKIPKIKTNKLDHNPLFIKILNWRGDRFTIEQILDSLIDKFESDSEKEIVRQKRISLDDSCLNGLTEFQKKFKGYVLGSIQANDVSEEFLFWLNNAFKYIQESLETYANNETRKIHIKDPNGRWLEGLFCYNLIMTINYFGIEIIKCCPICSSFFSHKGKYAKYCSEACKTAGAKTR